MEVMKIAFAGGSSSGKTTVMNGLKAREKVREDCRVIFLPEVASQFFYKRPKTIECADFPFIRQHYIYNTQLISERYAIELAEKFGVRRVVLLSDRGVCDVNTYLDAAQAAECLFERETQEELRRHYDAVLYMEPGNEENFRGDTTYRIEQSMDDISKNADDAWKAWKDCPNLHRIRQFPTAAEKVEYVAGLLNELIGAEVF